MITHITLQGFKRHRLETRLPLAPITLLLGGNSTGKSSVFQSLLLLKQTLEIRGPGWATLVTDGPRAALGSFGNVVNASLPRDDRRLRIGLNCEIRSDLENGEPGAESKRTWGIDLCYGNPEPDDGAGLGWTSDKHELRHLVFTQDDLQLTTTEWPWADADDTLALTRTVDLYVERIDRLVGKTPHSVWLAPPPAAPPAEVPEGAPVPPAPEPEPAYRIRYAAHDISILPTPRDEHRSFLPRVVSAPSNAFDSLLLDLRHIGPTRRPGARAYSLTHTNQPEVGAQGEHLLNLLVGGMADGLQDILDRLDIGYTLKTVQLGTLTQSWDIRLKDTRVPNGAEVGLGDVGFGISQVLPIVAEWAGILRRMSPDRPQTFLIEQPELHLHPRLQQRLVYELCRPAMNACDRQRRRAAGAGPDLPARPGEAQVLVETHSETVVLAVQQLVRGGHLRPEDVSILAFETGEDGHPLVKPIRLSAKGRFLDVWPKGFFEENEGLRLQEYGPAGAD